jgi:hypothetical protein
VDDALGVPVVFVTARPLRWMGDIWPYVGSHSLAIVSNGAILYDAAAGRVVDILGIEPEVGLPLLDDLAGALPRAGLGWSTRPGCTGRRCTSRRGPRSQHRLRPARTLAGAGREDARQGLLDPARAATSGGRGGRGRPRDADLVRAGAHRDQRRRRHEGLAVAGGVRSLGIDAADVVAFGDMPNDLDMMGWAGTSYAMANGHESVRAAATHVARPTTRTGSRVYGLTELYGL